MTELANSAAAVVGQTDSEKQTLSDRAKDIGSVLVFVSLMLLAIVWIGVV